ncbi:MAG TPA: hypothetical protein VFA67_14230 [Candidatus Sulfotelmatobacter sp.]|nr:hypothetical protein [Candidatus Sulfotelmatobacter sp.]
MFLIRPTRMCWICGKAVTPETFTTDKHGNAVHRRCHTARLALASAAYEQNKMIRRTTRSLALKRIPQVATISPSPAQLKTGSD